LKVVKAIIIIRVLLMLRNFRLASTTPLVTLSMSMEINTTLLADIGVPLLNLIQYTHLSQLHFHLTKTQPDTLPVTLF